MIKNLQRYSQLTFLTILALSALVFFSSSFASELASPAEVDKARFSQAENYRNQAIEAQNAGNLMMAMSFYSGAINLAPENTQNYCDLGAIYEAHGLNKEAQDLYSQALQVDPNCLCAYSNLALLYENNKEFGKAILAWQKRAELGLPDDYWTQKANERIEALSSGAPAEIKEAEVKEEPVIAEAPEAGQINAEYEERLSVKEQEVVDKEQEIAGLKQQIASLAEEKEQQIAEQNQELSADMTAKDQELSAKDQELSAKEQELSAKEQELCAKEEEIGSLNQQLASIAQQRQEELSKKEEAMSAKALEFEFLKEQVSSLNKKKEKEIASRDQELSAKEQEIESLKQQVAALAKYKQELAKKKQEESDMAEKLKLLASVKKPKSAPQVVVQAPEIVVAAPVKPSPKKQPVVAIEEESAPQPQARKIEEPMDTGVIEEGVSAKVQELDYLLSSLRDDLATLQEEVKNR